MAFSNEAQEKVTQAIEQETLEACFNWGSVYNSRAEAYAVLKEEVEEAEENLNNLKNVLNDFWTQSVKNNKKFITKKLVKKMRLEAELLAMEAVQVAAVCNKIVNTLKAEE